MEPAILTPEDRATLSGGQPLRIVIDDIPCVVLREDLFDAAEASDEDVRAAYPSVLRAWDADDENPEQYLEYLEQLKR